MSYLGIILILWIFCGLIAFGLGVNHVNNAVDKVMYLVACLILGPISFGSILDKSINRKKD